MYTVYTTDNCPKCVMLKNIITTKQWSNINTIHASESDIAMLKSLGCREFPAIIDQSNNLVSMQNFMKVMET